MCKAEQVFEKLSAFYHGHNAEKITKYLKDGIPSGEYLARRRWISDIYNKQWKTGKTIKVKIPKDVRKEYLVEDPANIMAKGAFGKLNLGMKRNVLIIKNIPKKFIVSGPMEARPNKIQMDRYFKELHKSTGAPMKDIVTGFKSIERSL